MKKILQNFYDEKEHNYCNTIWWKSPAVLKYKFNVKYIFKKKNKYYSKYFFQS